MFNLRLTPNGPNTMVHVMCQAPEVWSSKRARQSRYTQRPSCRQSSPVCRVCAFILRGIERSGEKASALPLLHLAIHRSRWPDQSRKRAAVTAFNERLAVPTFYGWRQCSRKRSDVLFQFSVDSRSRAFLRVAAAGKAPRVLNISDLLKTQKPTISTGRVGGTN